jgi:aminopeptidase N
MAGILRGREVTMAAVDVQADDLVPGHGDTSYSVVHYDLDLTYRHATNNLRGVAALRIDVTDPVPSLTLDLHALRVSSVVVAGAALKSWTHRRGRLVIRFTRALAPGTSLDLVIRYAGTPRLVPGPDGQVGWEELTDGVLVAAQPYGAPSWFPCNDRPSNKATYRMTIRASSEYLVVANGRLTARMVGGSTTTWEYLQSQPMATYLATVQLGRYLTTDLPAAVPVRLVYPPLREPAVRAAFARQADMVDVFVRLFGDYPFDGYTVVVTDDPLEIPVEAQTLSTFGSNYLRVDWDAERLIAHELSHQWFGNSVTARRWRDIWLHEGFACYAEWLWSEHSGRQAAAWHARVHWNRLARLPQDLVLADPEANRMFDDRVYKRGALFLHALRVTFGDDAFFTFIRAWTTRYRYGSVTTEDLIDLADELLGPQAVPLADAWLMEVRLPDLPGAP